MPITINGSGTVTGISAGGLPDACITTDDLAANAVTAAKLGADQASGLAKAWVNFNGTFATSPFNIANGGIRASFNVSSITDNGIGDYTVTFTTAMVDANYSTQLNGGFNNLASYNRHVEIYGTPTALAVRCVVQSGVADMEIMTCAVFR